MHATPCFTCLASLLQVTWSLRPVCPTAEVCAAAACSPHVSTGLWGLGLLLLQGMLSLFFEEDESLRTAHAYLGTGIMALFVVHAFLGLQLGLSI